MKLFGDWDKIQEVVTLAERFQKSVQRSVLAEGHRLRTGIVTGIASGAPGGKPFAPLSPITLAIRKATGFGGGKPLNVTGTIRGSIVVKKFGEGTDTRVFVGLLRQAKAKSGKPLANLGEIHEFGRTWTQPMSRKQYRFLFAMLRKAGVPPLVGPRRSNGALRSGSGMVTITIPARPFIGPVFEQERGGILKRFWDSVSKGVGGDLGRPR